jgi:ribosome-binding protein aMBF1 (putative translation factor)
MNQRKRQALETAGFRLGDAEDFLGLSEEERQTVELRVQLSRTVRRLRQDRKLTQQQLARKLKSSQSRVAKIEAGAEDVSLDLMFKSLFTLGGQLSDVVAKTRRAPRRARAGHS